MSVSKRAILFPGQGVQTQGMMALLRQESMVRPFFEKASALLQEDLDAVIDQQPEKLAQTLWTQMSIFVCSYASYQWYRAHEGHAPDWMAGHSLGEYTALACAGYLDYDSALKLVYARACAMQTCAQEKVGMWAVLGMAPDALQTLLAQAVLPENAMVYLSSMNSEKQSVLAGYQQGLDAFMPSLQQAGIRRVLPIAVQVPSHTPLMMPACAPMTKALDAVVWQSPTVPILHNLNAQMTEDNTQRALWLCEHLIKPVQWHATMLALKAKGVAVFDECGPGQILTGLLRGQPVQAQSLGHCPKTIAHTIAQEKKG